MSTPSSHTSFSPSGWHRRPEGRVTDLGRLLLGLCVVALGTLLLLGAAGVLDAGRAIDRWWPLVLVAAGLFTLAERPRAVVRGLLLTVAGATLVKLLAPVRDDLAEWQSASAASPASPVFAAASGGFWRATDWRNWRKRIYKPVAESVGIDGARPYHLRQAFASLLIHERRLSVVEITPPSAPYRSRTRASRFARRRSYSRRALAPAAEASGGDGGAGSHATQRVSRRAESHTASSPAGSGRVQMAHVSGRRSFRWRVPADTRRSSTDAVGHLIHRRSASSERRAP